MIIYKIEQPIAQTLSGKKKTMQGEVIWISL